MKRFLSIALSLCLALGCFAAASAETTVYEGSSQGFASPVGVKVTLEDGKVVGLEVDDSAETYATLAGIAREDSVDKVVAAILEAGTPEGVDAACGATYTASAVLV